MVESCERSVYIKVYIQCCSHCPGIFRRRWGRQSQTLLVVHQDCFVITIVPIDHVLQSRLPLITFLQSKQCNPYQRGIDYVITLVTIDHVLQSRLPLITFLQSKQCNPYQRGIDYANHYNHPAAAGEGRIRSNQKYGIYYLNVL